MQLTLCLCNLTGFTAMTFLGLDLVLVLSQSPAVTKASLIVTESYDDPFPTKDELNGEEKIFIFMFYLWDLTRISSQGVTEEETLQIHLLRVG